jgi:quinol monooxygenase YgiN
MKICLLTCITLAFLSSTIMAQEKVLRHVVSFKFKEDASTCEIEKVEKAFVALKDKIPGILSLEWGKNNSPEGLNKDFTHCFIVTFKDEKAREIYLPHPDHKAFVSILKPILADVYVIDFWAQ